MREAGVIHEAPPFRALPISGGLGAELRGVFIHSSMPPDEVDFIYQALLKH